VEDAVVVKVLGNLLLEMVVQVVVAEDYQLQVLEPQIKDMLEVLA
jgi:hypothetical protein